MTTTHRYPSIVDGEPGAYGVTIPDFPGCAARAETIEEAVEEATNALAELATRMIRDGVEFPEPSDAGEILEGRDSDADPIGVIYIPLELDSGRTVRTCITIDVALLRAVDDEAAKRGMTRSSFFAAAARSELGRSS